MPEACLGDVPRLSSLGLGLFDGMTGLVWYTGLLKAGDPLRIPPFCILCCNCWFWNWLGSKDDEVGIKPDGSIMFPPVFDSFIWLKPAPLWFWTAASFIQELMSVDDSSGNPSIDARCWGPKLFWQSRSLSSPELYATNDEIVRTAGAL